MIHLGRSQLASERPLRSKTRRWICIHTCVAHIHIWETFSRFPSFPPLGYTVSCICRKDMTVPMTPIPGPCCIDAGVRITGTHPKHPSIRHRGPTIHDDSWMVTRCMRYAMRALAPLQRHVDHGDAFDSSVTGFSSSFDLRYRISSTIPYSFASSAVRYLSRSIMSLMAARSYFS